MQQIIRFPRQDNVAHAALIGMRGGNPRKRPRSRDDLLDELSDVIIAGAIAMVGVVGDVS